MNRYCYFPIIKTRDAELNAVSHLPSDIFDYILPVYELTKSRKNKLAPDGDIHKRMRELCGIHNKRPFILDVSTNEKYMNMQIENLLEPDNGFNEWQYFLNTYNDFNIIPMIHIMENIESIEVDKFILSQLTKNKDLAVRFPLEIDSVEPYVNHITHIINGKQKLYIILDAEQLTERNAVGSEGKIKEHLAQLEKYRSENIIIIVAGTSFPKSVADYGDTEGDIPILEEILFNNLKRMGVYYGDYASINIEQIEIKGGTFVPRIDIPLESEFFYKRYRRKEGSYQRCAQQVVLDERYAPSGIWPNNEITLAKNDEASGISPSFWISVRMNYFMTTRVLLRMSK